MCPSHRSHWATWEATKNGIVEKICGQMEFVEKIRREKHTALSLYLSLHLFYNNTYIIKYNHMCIDIYIYLYGYSGIYWNAIPMYYVFMEYLGIDVPEWGISWEKKTEIQ